MDSSEIREFNKRFIKEFERASTGDVLTLAVEGAKVEVLVEIAAQLAELNHRMECLLDVQTRGLKE